MIGKSGEKKREDVGLNLESGTKALLMNGEKAYKKDAKSQR